MLGLVAGGLTGIYFIIPGRSYYVDFASGLSKAFGHLAIRGEVIMLQPAVFQRQCSCPDRVTSRNVMSSAVVELPGREILVSAHSPASESQSLLGDPMSLTTRNPEGDR